jgi:hypothetical protein
MIAIAKPTPKQKSQHDDSQFLQMLPRIRRQAHRAFRAVPFEQREELVAETVANCFVTFRRLVERDKADLAYPSVLANFAIRQVLDGRKVGSKTRCNDVGSRHCQALHGIKVQRLDRYNKRRAAWHEIVVEDRRAGPAEIATTRIDFDAWLGTLGRRERRITKVLATGETTNATARKFKVSPSRISQMRVQLKRAWQVFQGELPRPAAKRKSSLPAINRSLAAVSEVV